MRRALGVVALLPLLTAPAPLPAAEPSHEVAVERDITCGKGGTVDLKLDLARPKDGPGPYPAIVCILGGA